MTQKITNWLQDIANTITVPHEDSDPQDVNVSFQRAVIRRGMVACGTISGIPAGGSLRLYATSPSGVSVTFWLFVHALTITINDLRVEVEAEAQIIQFGDYRAASEQEEPVEVETCDELLEMLPATEESYTSVTVKGSTGNLYNVTMFEPSRANGCTCKGWTYRRECRHLRIAEKLPDTIKALDELINGRDIAVSEVVRSWRLYEGDGDSAEEIMDRIIAFVGESRSEGVRAL